MKERPIPFNAPMVRAILAGTKTQTRRLVKPQPGTGVGGCYLRPDGSFIWTTHHRPNNGTGDGVGISQTFSCPYGQPGDRLWVREAWRSGKLTDRFPPREMTPHQVWYEADGDAPVACNGKLRPAMFMPRWASRITLEVTEIRIERLQSITNRDALAEGIVATHGGYGLPDGSFYHALAPSLAYQSLFEHINGPGSVDRDPWVWVVAFKQVGPE